jgi:acyl-CoA synthetase (AMP-forming)/AMP-acid ligase II
VVVLREGKTLSAEAVIDYCRAHLASYKKPRKVVFVRELPRNASGKVLKQQLRG